MARSTTKKVEIRRFDREPLNGYVTLSDFLAPAGVQYLTLDGSLATLPYEQVKAVCFVRGFNAAAPDEPLVFQTRPKIEGLWVRLTFRDGEVMEGILPNDLLRLEAPGFYLSPPNPNSNTQRLWAPRSALESLEVLGVVGSPLRKKKPAPPEQPRLFD